MDLKGWINAKSEERRQEQQRRQEEAEHAQKAEFARRSQAELEAVKPHLLCGSDHAALEQYFRSLLVLRGEAKSFFSEEEQSDFAVRKLAKSLGLGDEERHIMQLEVSYYDEIAKQQLLGGFAASADKGVVSCFFCDFVKLLGEGYEFNGEPRELFRALAGGLFKLSENDNQSLERLCGTIASGNGWFTPGQFGDIPKPVLDRYLEMADVDYLVVDLSSGPQSEKYPVRYSQEAPDSAADTCRTTELWLKRIPFGAFLMGSPEDEGGHSGNECQHRVTLTQDFYLGVFPVTQRQWELVMGENPSYFKDVGPCAPVEQVSYDDICGKNRPWPADTSVSADSFLGRIRAKTGLTFDLPTEAQWEYACRAGTTTAFSFGNSCDGTQCNCKGIAPYRTTNKGPYLEKPTPVGEYSPNPWGLYDMHGNVWEWCRGWSEPYFGEATDPVGAATGLSRVIRGGGWEAIAWNCRSADRLSFAPDIRLNDAGFRLALLSGQDSKVVPTYETADELVIFSVED